MNYKESITSLVRHLTEDVLRVQGYTEAQAIAKATTNPNTIYYTSDTHCIVVGGNVYGRGQQLSTLFRWCPDYHQIGTYPYNDDRYIYVCEGGASDILELYAYYGGTWQQAGEMTISVPLEAQSISYDATSSALDADNVQDAIDEIDKSVDNKQDTLTAGDGIIIEQNDYVQLEWIGSDSTAWIDTGVSGNNANLEIEIEFSYSNYVAYGGIYGNYISDNVENTRCILHSTSGQITVQHKSKGAIYPSCALGTYHVLVSNHSRFTLDGTVYNASISAGTENDSNIAVLNRSVDNPHTSRDIGLKVKYFKIRDRGNLVCDLIPAKIISTGSVGMYDLKRKIFLEKQGTGIFTYGDEIPVVTTISTELQREEILGVNGRWADVVEEGLGVLIKTNNGYNIAAAESNLGNISTVAGTCMLISCEEGDKFSFWGLARSYNQQLPWAFYGTIPPALSASANTIRQYLLTHAPVATSSSMNTNDYAEEVTAPPGAKMLAVGWSYTAHELRDGVSILKWVEDPVSIADEKGRLIDSWYDDTLLPNDYTTEYDVGDTIGTWLGNQSYGCRGKRLAVKEGDKLLLDMFSPMRYGLYFTDNNLVVVSRYDDRRYDGVYTAPCNGYAYLIDVLYRDNYIYDKAVGHLAYMAYDARKKVTFGKDYYNEFCPNNRNGGLPLEVYKKPSANDSALALSSSVMKASILHDDGYVVAAIHIYLGENNEQTAGSFSVSYSSTFASTVAAGTRISAVKQPSMDGLISAGSSGMWAVSVMKNMDVADTFCFFRLYNSGTSTSLYLHLIVDKIYHHTFDTMEEAMSVAKAIGRNEYDISQMEGVQVSMRDPWMQAMGTTSALGLGYDIFEKGASLPMDNEGFAYGVALKGTAGKQFGGSEANADRNLVYLPVMDWSAFTGTKNSVFQNCQNLVTIPDIEWSSSLVLTNDIFHYCYVLKQVGNLTPAKCQMYYTFSNCYALESVGDIETTATPNMYNCFLNCYSLKRIGSITFGGAVNNLTYAFAYCMSLETFPSEIPITDSCTTIIGAFQNCTMLTDSTLPVITRNGTSTDATANVQNMQYMFQNCVNLHTAPVYNMDSVLRLDYMFMNSGIRQYGNLSAPLCTNASLMFSNCPELTSVGNINLPSATSISQMFYYTKSLVSVGNLYCPSLTGSQSQVFAYSTIQTIGDINLGSATATPTMFDSCHSLSSTGSITMTSANKDIRYMFRSCTSLTSIPALETSGVTQFDQAFSYCTSLTTILSLDFSSITAMTNMFLSCTALVFMEIKNLGKSSGLATYDFTALTNWGTGSGSNRGSLLATMTTNLYDRTGMTKGTIKLSANSYDLLDDEGSNTVKASIVAKNYDLYRVNTKYT